MKPYRPKRRFFAPILLIVLFGLAITSVMTKNMYFMFPLLIFIFFLLPAIATSASVKLGLAIISIMRRLGARARSDLSRNIEYATSFPSTKKMIFWTTVNTVGFICSAVTGGGWIPGNLFDLSSNIGLLAVIYLPAIIIASAFNVAMWLIQTQGLTFKRRGFGELSIGAYFFNIVSVSIGVVGIARMAISLLINGDPYGITTILVLNSIFAFVTSTVSFLLAKRVLIPRLIQEFQLQINRLAL